MENEYQQVLEQAPPSTPVKITGLKEVPFFGDALQVVPDEKTAKIVLADIKKATRMKDNERKTAKKMIPLVLKADVLGSLKAIKDSLKKIETEEVGISLVKEGVGDVSDDDVMMATSAKARIICFKVNVPTNIQKLIEKEKIVLASYTIIYDLINDLKEIINFLSRKEVEVKTGSAVVLKVFRSEKSEKIVGVKMQSGTATKGQKVVVLQNNARKGEGKILSLQIEQTKVESLPSGKLGGIRVGTEIELAENDILEFYKKELK
jgi:translation initiation factor IF-2